MFSKPGHTVKKLKINMNAAGYCSTSVNNYFVWNSNGLNSSDTNTSSFIDGIFRTETSAGSSHRGAQELEKIDATEAGQEASYLAKEGQNPVDIDPGKYEVLLGNEAVSTILVFLAVYGFNAKSEKNFTDVEWSGNNILLFGSEGTGIKKHTEKYTDFSVKININKNIESLNISNSAAIVFHHINKVKKIT